MFDLNRFVKNVIAPQRSNRYTMNIYKDGFDEIALLAENVSFPTFGFDKLSSTYRYGFGVKDSFPGVPENKQLMVTFIMQQGSKEFGLFTEWLNQIIAHVPDENGAIGPSNYTVEYKEQYVTTAELRLHSEVEREESEESYWKFIDLFPISITGDPLAWKTEDSYVTYVVTFEFYAYQFIASDIPVATEPRVRTKDGNAPSTLPYRTSPDPIDDSLEGLPQILGG